MIRKAKLIAVLLALLMITVSMSGVAISTEDSMSVTAGEQQVTTVQTEQINITVKDSRGGEDTETVDIHVGSGSNDDSTELTPIERVTTILDKPQDQINQGDVTTMVTFEANDFTQNGVTVTQDDVTTTVTLNANN